MAYFRAVLLLLIGSVCMFAQGGQARGVIVQGQNGYATISSPTSIQVCPYDPNLLCSGSAGIYSDAAMQNSMSNPFNADANGYYSYYAAPGTYVQKTCLPYSQCTSTLVTIGGGGSGPTQTPTSTQLSSEINTSYSSTPVFNSFATVNHIRLTGPVVASTLAAGTAGYCTTFQITQDAVGGRTFVWPSNVSGGMVIGTTANKRSSQTFCWSTLDNLWEASSPGVINQ